MKHKLLFGFAAAAMAAVMCVGFAACGGGPDAKSVKGEEVTADQWEAAMDALSAEDAKYTLEMSFEQTADGYTADGTATLIVNGAKAHYTTKVTEEFEGEKGDYEDDVYSEYKDGKYTIYRKDIDGKWTTSQEESSNNPFTFITILGTVFNDFPVYEDYEYSADDKGYVLKEVADGETSPVIKFDKDGKLVAVYCNGLLFYGYDIEFNAVIDYDAKDITLPTVE